MAEIIELVTFRVGPAHLGVDIHQIQEINRLIDVTPVPQAPPHVRGVINLRGEVVTVLDLRTILGLPGNSRETATRNVIVRTDEEPVGLLVDEVADVVHGQEEQLEKTPANVAGIDGRFFEQVCKLDERLILILDVAQVLSPAAA